MYNVHKYSKIPSISDLGPLEGKFHPCMPFFFNSRVYMYTHHSKGIYYYTKLILAFIFSHTHVLSDESRDSWDCQ